MLNVKKSAFNAKVMGHVSFNPRAQTTVLLDLADSCGNAVSVNVFAKGIFLVHSHPNLAHFEPCLTLFALLVENTILIFFRVKSSTWVVRGQLVTLLSAICD